MKAPRPSSLKIEQLEDRCVPATWWNPWPDGQHLTLSFVRDGTDVAGLSSDLFQTLNQTASTNQWQLEVLRAFQTWAMHANINIGLVADGGQAIGTPGFIQGDSRFGDIRIAALAMSPEVLAVASPFETGAGTWSGDVKLNSAYTFGINGRGELDLRTVLIHEAGHVFGIDTNPTTESVTYEDYQGIRHTLGAIDIAQIQALYGARLPDAFEGSSGNETRSRATTLSLLKNLNGSLGVTIQGDLTTMSDVDVYKFTAPLNLGGLTVNLKTSGLSLLAPKLTVYDKYGRVIASKVSADPFSGDLSIRVPKPGLLQTYYIQVERGTADVFGVGSYELEVESVPQLGGLLGILGPTVQTLTSLLNIDLHTNDSFLTAGLLSPLLGQPSSSAFDYAYKASLHDKYDVDFYQIQAPKTGGSVMSVMTWGIEPNALVSKVSVYDANRNPVASEILVNENGTHTLQVTGVKAGASYYVKIEAASSQNNIGNYFLGVDFSDKAVQLHTLGEGTLDAGHAVETDTMLVQRNGLFHFVFSAESATGKTGTPVTVTILDDKGDEVTRMIVVDGQTVSQTVNLKPGIYTFRYEVEGTTTMSYRLRGQRLNDPIGPQPVDTTTSPETMPPPDEPPTESEDNYWYYYEEEPVYDDPAATEDPYSDPYTTEGPETTDPADDPYYMPPEEEPPPAEETEYMPPPEEPPPPTEDTDYMPPEEPPPPTEDTYYYEAPPDESPPTEDPYYYEAPPEEPPPPTDDPYYMPPEEPPPEEEAYYMPPEDTYMMPEEPPPPVEETYYYEAPPEEAPPNNWWGFYF
jgi:hypothetical protein